MQQDVAAYRSTSLVIKLKLHLLQCLQVFYSNGIMYSQMQHDSYVARQERFVARQKIVDLPGISTSRVTSFDCLRHIHLSFR